MTEQELRELLPELEPEMITELAGKGSLREFTENELLMKTGQYFRSMMIVVQGLVKVFREDDEGNEYFIYYLHPGEACALSMVCALRQEKSEVMARAVSDVTVISVPLDQIDGWMSRYKSWAEYVLSSYRRRFEELLTTIDQIAFRNMDERLLFYLKKNQQSLKSNIIPFTHAAIAQELNSSREVISRLMKKLADRGIIRMHRQHIEIIDPLLLS